MTRISRSKLARYVAAEILDGKGLQAIRELAAYLVETGRTREADLVVRAIYEQLENEGVIVAEATVAHDADSSLADEIKAMLGARQLELAVNVQPEVLGGVRVQTPSRLLDSTFTRRLSSLRERKV